MFDIEVEEQSTLALLATRKERQKFDGSMLHSLYRKGLVEISLDGWTVTPLGRIVAVWHKTEAAR